jgi:hypothetical protein
VGSKPLKTKRAKKDTLRGARIKGEAARLGRVVASKDSIYGDATRKAGRLLRLLYPRGMKPCEYGEALLVVRVLDKLCRIANGCGTAGEDAWRDIAGYGLLALVNRRKTRVECRRAKGA